MKKVIIFIISILPIYVIAQKKPTIEINSQGGYEYNLFKSPTSISKDNTIYGRTDIIKSSPIIRVGLKFDYQKKWKKHILHLDWNANHKSYPAFMKGSILTVNLMPKYEFKLSKKVKLFTQLNARYIYRHGQEGATDLFNILSPYYSYGYSGGIQFNPNRKQRLELEIGNGQKKYINTRNASLKYHEFRTKFSFRQKFKKESLISQTNISAEWKRRNYNSFIPSNSTNIIDEELVGQNNGNSNKYDLNYFILNTSAKIKLGKKVYVRPGMEFLLRSSNKNKSLAYRQFKPKFDISYQHKNTTLKLRNSYSYRRYNAFNVGAKNDNLQLKYHLFKTSLTWEQKIAKKLYLSSQFQLSKRISNRTDITKRANRSYLQSSALIGLKWKF